MQRSKITFLNNFMQLKFSNTTFEMSNSNFQIYLNCTSCVRTPHSKIQIFKSLQAIQTSELRVLIVKLKFQNWFALIWLIIQSTRAKLTHPTASQNKPVE